MSKLTNYNVKLSIHKLKAVRTVRNDRMALTAVNTHMKKWDQWNVTKKAAGAAMHTRVTRTIWVITRTYMYNAMQTQKRSHLCSLSFKGQSSNGSCPYTICSLKSHLYINTLQAEICKSEKKKRKPWPVVNLRLIMFNVYSYVFSPFSVSFTNDSYPKNYFTFNFECWWLFLITSQSSRNTISLRCGCSSVWSNQKDSRWHNKGESLNNSSWGHWTC